MFSEKNKGSFWELSDELREFDVYIDVWLMVYMFCAKILFGVIVPFRVPFMGQIVLFNHLLEII